MSEDEYNLSFPNLTEEDLALIDSNEAGKPRQCEVSAKVVEIEDAVLSRHDTEEPPQQSPFAQYRHKGTFTVTDLVSPAW
jgi:hypothetical protein